MAYALSWLCTNYTLDSGTIYNAFLCTRMTRAGTESWWAVVCLTLQGGEEETAVIGGLRLGR